MTPKVIECNHCKHTTTVMPQPEDVQMWTELSEDMGAPTHGLVSCPQSVIQDEELLPCPGDMYVIG